jgi:hypothetical protein
MVVIHSSETLVTTYMTTLNGVATQMTRVDEYYLVLYIGHMELDGSYVNVEIRENSYVHSIYENFKLFSWLD